MKKIKEPLKSSLSVTSISKSSEDYITKLQNLMKQNLLISLDQAKMQILKELFAQMNMIISPEPSTAEIREATIEIDDKKKS